MQQANTYLEGFCPQEIAEAGLKEKETRPSVFRNNKGKNNFPEKHSLA